MLVELADDVPRVLELGPGRFQRRHSAGDIASDLTGGVEPPQLHVVPHSGGGCPAMLRRETNRQ